MNDEEMNGLLLLVVESLECSICIFEVALPALEDDAADECARCLCEAKRKRAAYLDAIAELGLDATSDSAERRVVRYRAQSLIDLMHLAGAELPTTERELIARKLVEETKHKLALSLAELARLVDEPAGGSRQTGTRFFRGCQGRRHDAFWFSMPTTVVNAASYVAGGGAPE
ncbi:MAG: hypothetical protein R3B89_32750 [Polyangiaceae bacterium]